MMSCARCGGLMSTTYERQDVDLIALYKCLNCGEVVDPTILRNRRVQPKPRHQAIDRGAERDPVSMPGCQSCTDLIPDAQRPLGTNPRYTNDIDGRVWCREVV